MSTIWIGQSNGCWIDLWDQVEFKGNTVRLWGPSDFPLLRIGVDGWKQTIESIRVGPGAYVQWHEELNFENSVYWMLPGQSVKSLKNVSCCDDIDSLRLFDRPPYAREPGYRAYMLWAAHQLENGPTAKPSISRKTPNGLH